MNEESDYFNKIKSLTEEVRVFKVKAKDYQEKYNIERESNSELKDKIREMDIKLNNLKIRKKTGSPVSSKESESMKEKIMILESEIEILNQKLGAASRRVKSTKTVNQREVKQLQDQIIELEIHLRDKDKENRLLTLRLKEYQRLSKFKHLKPIDPDLLQNSEIGQPRAKSTMRNQNSDLFNPDVKSMSKRLNQNEIRIVNSSRKSKQRSIGQVDPPTTRNKDL